MNEDALKAWGRLCDKWRAQGYGALSEPERVWLNVRCLIDSIQNGGLISYYYNSGADDLRDCMAGLRQLGAVSVLRAVDRVNALFPDGVPTSVRGRNEVIDAWPDDGRIGSLLSGLDDEIMPLMESLEASLDKYIVENGLAP